MPVSCFGFYISYFEFHCLSLALLMFGILGADDPYDPPSPDNLTPFA
jgi:hypothetical protein